MCCAFINGITQTRKIVIFVRFLRFFKINSNLVGVSGNNSSDLFVEYFCEFFDTPGVTGSVEIEELEFPIQKYFLDSNLGNYRPL